MIRPYKDSIHGPRILLIRLDHLGDLILTTPILTALKESIPNAHITILVSPGAEEIVNRHPAVNQIIIVNYPPFQRSKIQHNLSQAELLRLAYARSQELKKQQYDIAINLRPDFWWGDALMHFANISLRLSGFLFSHHENTKNALFSPSHYIQFSPDEHSVARSLRLINSLLSILGYSLLEKPYRPEYYPLHFEPYFEEEEWADVYLQQLGINNDSPFIVIHPGSGAIVKCWRDEAWAWLANEFSTISPFHSAPFIILTGTEAELPMLENIAHRIKLSCKIVIDISIGYLAGLLKRAKIVFGVDSGPLHLAIALDQPTLQIFGPVDVNRFGPWGRNCNKHYTISSHYRCPSCPKIPCGRINFDTNDLINHQCVKKISEQTVKGVTLKLLQENF